MGLLNFLSNLLKSDFDRFLESASDKELEDAYEERRLEWLKTTKTGEKTDEMKRLDKEISNRSYEKWKKNPNRNTDPNYRWSDANRWDKD